MTTRANRRLLSFVVVAQRFARRAYEMELAASQAFHRFKNGLFGGRYVLGQPTLYVLARRRAAKNDCHIAKLPVPIKSGT